MSKNGENWLDVIANNPSRLSQIITHDRGKYGKRDKGGLWEILIDGHFGNLMPNFVTRNLKYSCIPQNKNHDTDLAIRWIFYCILARDKGLQEIIKSQLICKEKDEKRYELESKKLILENQKYDINCEKNEILFSETQTIENNLRNIIQHNNYNIFSREGLEQIIKNLFYKYNYKFYHSNSVSDIELLNKIMNRMKKENLDKDIYELELDIDTSCDPVIIISQEIWLNSISFHNITNKCNKKLELKNKEINNIDKELENYKTTLWFFEKKYLAYMKGILQCIMKQSFDYNNIENLLVLCITTLTTVWMSKNSAPIDMEQKYWEKIENENKKAIERTKAAKLQQKKTQQTKNNELKKKKKNAYYKSSIKQFDDFQDFDTL